MKWGKRTAALNIFPLDPFDQTDPGRAGDCVNLLGRILKPVPRMPTPDRKAQRSSTLLPWGIPGHDT
jgi:hypothetical protein